MRRAGPSSGPARDRWIVSYADLVTILLACFATTYAAESVPASASPPVESRRAAPEPMVVEGSNHLRELVAPIVAANATRQIAFAGEPVGGTVVIALPESASFATGRADLAAPAREFLGQLAEALRGTSVQLRIEGHTDTVPVTGGRFTSNWDLSTARASAVVAYLVDDGAIPPERLAAAGYAEFHPRVANDSPEHRALNRRVDVVLIDPDAR